MIRKNLVSILLVLLLVSFVILPVVNCDDGDKSNNKEDRTKKEVSDDDSNNVGDGGNDDVLQLNPDYIEPTDDDDFDPDDYDDYDDSDDDDDEGGSGGYYDGESRTKLSVALAKLRRSATSRKKPWKLIRKHRSRITLALAIFAFRKEIFHVLSRVATKAMTDPKTGEVTYRRINPTAILKFLLFVDFMWRIKDEDGVSGFVRSKMLPKHAYNPTYIPALTQHYTFERINERYVKDGLGLQKAITNTHEGFGWKSSPSPMSSLSSSSNGGHMMMKQYTQCQSPAAPLVRSDQTVIILDWTGLDGRVSTMSYLRDQVSFLLSQYRVAATGEAPMEKRNNNTTKVNNTQEDSQIDHSTQDEEMEIIVLLESAGGGASDYGLAAQQLLRLRNEPGIRLTICVDKVAASGGYMLACTASPGGLIAAPFALLGSIGVVSSIVNVHRLLEGWGVTPLVFRGGKDKVPIGLIGEVSDESRDTFQAMIDDVHRAFKRHVVLSRPVLENTIDEVGTGDVWLGSDALDLHLVDRLCTSDEYITEKVKIGARVLKMKECVPSLFGMRYGAPILAAHQRLSVRGIALAAMSKVANLFGLNVPAGSIPSLESSVAYDQTKIRLAKVSSQKKPL